MKYVIQEEFVSSHGAVWTVALLHDYHDRIAKYMHLFPLGNQLAIPVTVGVAARN